MDHKQRSWYIPRPSLSANSNNVNQNNDSIRSYHRDSEVIDIERPSKKLPAKAHRSSAVNSSPSSSSSTISSQRQHVETCVDGDCDAPKRGSRSSQGSSDSEQSIHVSPDHVLINHHMPSFDSLPAERLIASTHCRESRKLCQNSRTISQSSSIIFIISHCKDPSIHQHSSQQLPVTVTNQTYQRTRSIING